MKHLYTFLLLAVLFFSHSPAQASDMTFRCHGRAYETGFFFKYDFELHDAGNSRVRLTTSGGFNDSLDYGWKEFKMTGSKIPVDSPFHEYKAFIVRDGRNFSLVLVDPATSVPVDNPPYDRFVCVVPL